MVLSYAFLADHAQIEGGKVFVLGGGVTVLWRSSFPAGIGVTVVFSVTYNNTEVGSNRSFRIDIHNEDGQAIAPALHAEFTLPARRDGAPSSVPLESAFAIDIAGNVPIIPEPGNYVLELTLDGNHVRSLPFAAVELETDESDAPA
jgi:hypothetical protein